MYEPEIKAVLAECLDALDEATDILDGHTDDYEIKIWFDKIMDLYNEILDRYVK